LFQNTDDNILQYLNDDGLSVEPIYYAPIIPMILVNGSKGIGTGFSTDIMCYNPLQIIDYLQNKLIYIEDDIDFIPYYEGFNGTITKISDDKVLIKGIYEKIAIDKIRVTELPVGYWTEDFKELIEYWINPGEDKEKNKIPPIIKDYEDMSKDTNVDFTIIFVKGKLEEIEKSKGDYGCNGLEKLLKLYTTNTTTNMHLFDANDTLHKYEKISDIIDSYYDIRLKLYQTRKDYMIESLEKELIRLTNRAKYIKENLDGTIDLRKKNKEEVKQMLESKEYDKMMDNDENDYNYKYLIKMPMDSVTEENVEKLNKEHGNKEAELEIIKKTTINKMWLNELNELKKQYIEYKEKRIMVVNGAPKKKVASKTDIKKVAKKQRLVLEDNLI
jgi:DNA topoisomerase-2